MAKTLISSSRYIQGPGELKNIGTYASKYGKKALAIISKGGTREKDPQWRTASRKKE